MNNRDIINELSKRYKELQEEFKSVQDLVNDIDFVFDYTEEEQHLFYKTSYAMEEHCGALLKLTRFLKKQELEEKNIKDWSQYKKTDSTYIGVDVSNEGDHGAHCQVCGDAIATQQDRRNEAALKLCNLLVKGRMSVYAPSKKCAKCGGNLSCGIGVKEGKEIICFNCANQITNEELQQALDEYRAACTHHCGQDESCPVGDGSAAVNETPDSLKSLEGMLVIKVCSPKCKDSPCGDGLREYPSGRDASSCVKVELVGGYMLCLAPLPNSVVTE